MSSPETHGERARLCVAYTRAQITQTVLHTALMENRAHAADSAEAMILGAIDALVLLIGRRAAFEMVSRIADETASPILSAVRPEPRGA